MSVAHTATMLTLTIVEGKRLYPSDKGGGRDVFMTGQLLSDAQGLSIVSVPVIKKTRDPEWNA